MSRSVEVKVLVACEESQRVCMSFRNKGHNAYSCDLQDCSGGFPQYHIKGNVLDYINGHCEFITCDSVVHNIAGRWDMIIAFPPCTYFSRVNFFNYYRKGVFNAVRFNKAMDYVDLFWLIYNADCDKIAIENPVPISIIKDYLPPISSTFQPYEFGEEYSKKTCLWLKGLPVLLPTLLCMDFKPYVVINGNLINGTFNLAEQSKYRSKTFNGVARAMAQQWG